MIKQKFLFFIGLFLVGILFSGATETGEIKGKVTDENGQGLPGIEIRIQSPNLQGTRSLLSSKNGEFTFHLLPVGEYRLTFRLDGFSTVIQERVIVRLGRVTNLRVVMKPSDIQEEILVTAPSPLIDKTSTDTSYTIGGEELEKIPVQNRTVVDVVKFTPGVTGVRVNTRRGTSTEGQPSFRGEGEEGNTWIVDGLAISGVRLKNSGMRINFDSLDEVQIISDPFSPEYGPAYGGIVNMVTKSGSNAFHGELSLVFTNKDFQAARQDQLSTVSAPDYFSDTNWYIDLGGPLIKDRLWFYLSNNYFTDEEETRDGQLDYLSVPGGEKSVRSNNLFLKISYAVNDDHSLSATSIFQTSLGQKGGTGIPELYDEKSFSDTMFRINYKGILNSSTFIEAGLGRVERDSLIEPLDGDLGPAQHYIEDLARNLNNSYGRVTDDQNRLDLSIKLTKHLPSEQYGNHEFNLGVEYYDFSSTFGVDFSGKTEDLFPGNGFDAGAKYNFDTWRGNRGTPTISYEYGPFDFVNSARGFGVYVKDKLTWGRFTIMAGLRSQTQNCLDNRGEKLWSWGLKDFLSPRFSLSVDITGDGINVLKFGWGRFSDLITTMPLGLLNSGAGLTFRSYRWKGPLFPSESELHEPSNWIFENEQRAQPFVIDDDITPNFLNRYLVGYERRLGRNWAFSGRFVRSSAEDLLEVLAVLDPETQYQFLYDNFELKKRSYWGIEVELNGRVGSSFYLNASYCRSSAKGTNPGQTETGSWAQEEGSTNYLGLFGNHIFVPNLPVLKELKEYVDWALGGLGGRGIGDEGWYGPLPYSVDHSVKVNAIYLAPWGLAFSTAFEYLSGYPYEKLGYVPFFGGYYSFPEGRGTRSTPPHFYLDMGVEKEFKLAGLGLPESAGLILRFSVFNLLDSQKPVSYVKEDIPIFNSVWARQQPRQARLSVKFKW